MARILHLLKKEDTDENVSEILSKFEEFLWSVESVLDVCAGSGVATIPLLIQEDQDFKRFNSLQEIIIADTLKEFEGVQKQNHHFWKSDRKMKKNPNAFELEEVLTRYLTVDFGEEIYSIMNNGTTQSVNVAPNLVLLAGVTSEDNHDDLVQFLEHLQTLKNQFQIWMVTPVQKRDTTKLFIRRLKQNGCFTHHTFKLANSFSYPL